MAKPRSAPNGVETSERFVKVTWSDDGKHRVEVVGIRRRYDVERLLKAVRRHAFACQMRGLPLDTAEVPRMSRAEEADALA